MDKKPRLGSDPLEGIKDTAKAEKARYIHKGRVLGNGEGGRSRDEANPKGEMGGEQCPVATS